MRFTRSASVLVAAGIVVVFLCAQAVVAQRQREPKAQRLEQLNGVLTRLDQSIEILTNEPSAQGAKQHKQELEHLKKARDAAQRLVNNVEGRDDNADVQKDVKRDERAAKNRPPTDYYSAILQVRQNLDQDYAVLTQDPGKNNVHRNNALKFIQQAREPIARDVEAYAQAHPEIARQAQPAAAAQPGAAPAQPGAAGNGELQDLQKIIPHEDHSIDILTNQPANSPNRQELLTAIVRARDASQGLISAVGGGNQQKDVAAEHARDASQHRERAYGYLEGLQTIQEYLKNDHIILSRQPDDSAHLRATAMQSLEQAQTAVQQAIDAYVKAHPNEKH